MAPVIPIEIYRPIIELVTQKHDLCSVARSSTILQFEAERILYKYISMETYLVFFNASKSIISNPRRHQLVQMLNVHHITLSRPKSLKGKYFRESSVARLVARLLRVTTQLKALRIISFPGWVLHHAYHPFLNCLTIRFFLRQRTDPLKGDDYPRTMAYLERHPSIQKLVLGMSHGHPYHRHCALHDVERHPRLPNLNTLHISGPGLLHLVRDRRLKTFCLANNLYESVIKMTEAISHILVMGSTLVILDLSKASFKWSRGLERHDITKIAGSLPQLRYLGLPAPDLSTPQQQELWEDNIVHSIRTYLPILMVFRLDFNNGPFAPHFSPERIIPEVLAIRECLRWIMITTKAEGFQTMVHTREGPPKFPNEDVELQHAFLGLDAYIKGNNTRFSCFPANNASWA